MTAVNPGVRVPERTWRRCGRQRAWRCGRRRDPTGRDELPVVPPARRAVVRLSREGGRPAVGPREAT
uniref:hypothetical protein n=1 Tax=Actinoalloteichus spitiensis TaxID=252394 RepID=UPI00058479E9